MSIDDMARSVLEESIASDILMDCIMLGFRVAEVPASAVG